MAGEAEREEAEERGRVGGRGGGPRPAASAGPGTCDLPGGGGAGRGAGQKRAGEWAPPGHADSRPDFGLAAPSPNPRPADRGAQPSPLGTPGEVGGSRGLTERPPAPTGGTGRLAAGGGRGTGQPGPRASCRPGARMGAGGSPPTTSPHPHPHPPQHAQYVGPYRLRRRWAKDRQVSQGRGHRGVGERGGWGQRAVWVSRVLSEKGLGSTAGSPG